ncbi:MAG: thiamine-phosphate kinase, partial [Deltaproteobacteria bacterium]|nr:thiamine-phosphate kinase [Deltaproteobacteria bacterium]
MLLKKVGEFGLIELLARQTSRAHPDVIKGIGDDAAVIRPDAQKHLLVTTDTLQEDVHFRMSFCTPFQLGKKSMSVNLSDIAAMGGAPLYYFVSLGVPSKITVDVIKKIYRGMDSRAKRFGAVLLGGDTVASPGGLVITVTLIGSASAKEVVFRCGARPGDRLYVTGYPGESALGLRLLQQGGKLSGRNRLAAKHLDPLPRIDEARAIAARRLASSMIDVSDGLAADLRHILQESRVGARLYLDRLPLSRAYRKNSAAFSSDLYLAALCGGEDYELLLTVPPRKLKAFEKLVQMFSVPCTRIGEITAEADDLEIID